MAWAYGHPAAAAAEESDIDTSFDLDRLAKGHSPPAPLVACDVVDDGCGMFLFIFLLLVVVVVAVITMIEMTERGVKKKDDDENTMIRDAASEKWSEPMPAMLRARVFFRHSFEENNNNKGKLQ